MGRSQITARYLAKYFLPGLTGNPAPSFDSRSQLQTATAGMRMHSGWLI